MAEYKIMNINEFSVCQFFKTGGHEYVRRYVSGEEAIRAFNHYTSNVASKIGLVVRVIITDGGDNINMEWEEHKGITFPPQEQVLEQYPHIKEAMIKEIKKYHTEEDGE